MRQVLKPAIDRGKQMFTGVIEQIGKLVSVEERRHQRKLKVQTNWDDVKVGETIALNGVSLVVTDFNSQRQAQFLVTEDLLERSTLNKLEVESQVNLERGLIPSSRMGGHFVQGCVDSKGLVLNLTQRDGMHKITLALDSNCGRYCAARGSITVEGVSLMIHEIVETKLNEFMISCLVAPQIWKKTTLPSLKIADAVNVEVDMMAKYIERLSPQIQHAVVTTAAQTFAAHFVAPVAEVPAEADADAIASAEATAENAPEPIEASEPGAEAAADAAPAAEMAAEDSESIAASEAMAAASESEPALEAAPETISEASAEPAELAAPETDVATYESVSSAEELELAHNPEAAAPAESESAELAPEAASEMIAEASLESAPEHVPVPQHLPETAGESDGASQSV